MEVVKIYLTNLDVDDTSRFGMTQNQLFFIEILCKKLNLMKEFKQYIIPNGYEDAYSKITKPNAALLIGALKDGNSVELIANAEMEKQLWNKYGGTVDTKDVSVSKPSMVLTETESKFVNPDDLLSVAQREINDLLTELRKHQKVTYK